LCGALHVHPYPDLYVDAEGARWDVCRTCAEREQAALEAHDLGG
jgi:hypothetical protein